MLTKKIFLLLGIILALIACSDAEKVPADVIDTKTMSQILADIHLIEAKSSRISFQAYDSTKVVYSELERRVMAKYKIDTGRYKASYKYYVSEPERMIKIYDETLKILKDLEQKRKKGEKIKNSFGKTCNS